MEVFMWFMEEFPFIWMPVVFFILLVIILSGCAALLLVPVFDYFVEKDGGVMCADDF